MTVIVRSKRSERIRRTRFGSSRHLEGHSGTTSSTAPAKHGERPAASLAERRLTNDRAMYSCMCGFVFDAPVSTSVHCPHCGDTQAW
jgi:hypothetical protein